MPIFLACISFMLVYTVFSAKVVNPSLALETVKVVFGGDSVFTLPERDDIYVDPELNDGNSGGNGSGDSNSDSIGGTENEADEDNGDENSSDNNGQASDGKTEQDAEDEIFEGKYVYLKDITFPKFNTKYGVILFPTLHHEFDLIMGESEQGVVDGVVTYTSSYIPGYGGTTLTSTHNNHVVNLEKLNTDDEIIIKTSYGVFTYKVREVKVVNKDDKTAFAVNSDDNRLIFFTCYPLRRPSGTTERMVVYADLVSGVKIIK